jgi:hypothetical protein
VQRIPAAALPPQDTAACEAFLAKSFSDKEARLKRFYEKGVPLEKEAEEAEKQQPSTERSSSSSSSSRVYAAAARAAYAQGLLVMGLLATAVVALARWLSPWVFFGYVAGVTGVTVFVMRYCEGWDSLELRLGGEEQWVDGSGGGGGGNDGKSKAA